MFCLLVGNSKKSLGGGFFGLGFEGGGDFPSSLTSFMSNRRRINFVVL